MDCSLMAHRKRLMPRQNSILSYKNHIYRDNNTVVLLCGNYTEKESMFASFSIGVTLLNPFELKFGIENHIVSYPQSQGALGRHPGRASGKIPSNKS